MAEFLWNVIKKNFRNTKKTTEESVIARWLIEQIVENPSGQSKFNVSRSRDASNAGDVFIVIVNTFKCENGDGPWNSDDELMLTFSAGNNSTFKVG